MHHIQTLLDAQYQGFHCLIWQRGFANYDNLKVSYYNNVWHVVLQIPTRIEVDKLQGALPELCPLLYT